MALHNCYKCGKGESSQWFLCVNPNCFVRICYMCFSSWICPRCGSALKS